jgi:hypothetical protein
MITEADEMAIDAALESNPLGIAEAEGHLKKGILILSQEIGLTATRNVIDGIMTRLECEMPTARLH